MPNHRATLAEIRTFPSLVRFLRDEMDWPIESDDFDELTFDYEPEELGIDKVNQAKIRKIKRLRPLESGQPWGIFFVEFEPKRLPVVALRRILSAVALKKRASANAADRASWRAGDLLFVSNYGDGDERQITFAHFAQDEAKDDLPTLRVLGWDNQNTALRLDHVAEVLTSTLRWRLDGEDPALWSRRWQSAFTLRHRETITTAKDLSVRLAELARAIRDRIRAALAIETERGRLTALLNAFREALIHDLDQEGFADTYAQTIAYGLLSARIANPKANTADDFGSQLPVTSPFLREMMEAFLRASGRRRGHSARAVDFDELGLGDVVDLLDHSNMEEVLRDFGDKNPEEDPVIHFYELFLREYDAKKRMQRGVFYTPRPVVSYIVRSVHERLIAEFGLRDGLADITTWGEIVSRFPSLGLPEGVAAGRPFVTILDPATGTGTFLVEVIDVVWRTMRHRWSSEGASEGEVQRRWNHYVPNHLLPRLHGFELLMAPYAVAHLKVGLKLLETGYRFQSPERARIYLTNALEPPQHFSDRLAFAVPALAHEAQAVNEVKQAGTFTAVLGNPPYAQYSMNLTESAKRHIEPFRYANGQRIRSRNPLQLERNLNDDYVKFLGAARGYLATVGVVGFITNRMYLESQSLVGLRQWIASTFSHVTIVDLRGSAEDARRIRRLAADENVFDILQGVAVLLSARAPGHERLGGAAVAVRELVGTREVKYQALLAAELSGSAFDVTVPSGPDWFLHRSQEHSVPAEEGFALPEVFQRYSTLVASNRDHLVVSMDKAEVVRNVESVKTFRGSDEELAERFGITLKAGWNVAAARQSLRQISDVATHVASIEYRPFDRRWIFFHPSLVWQSAPVVSSSVLRAIPSRVLVALGKNRSETVTGYWVTRRLADKSVVSIRDNASGFPLVVYPKDGLLDFGRSSSEQLNLARPFLRSLAERLGLPTVGEWGLPLGISAESIFDYVYSLLYCESYRRRYAAVLSSGFPVVPLPGGREVFDSLAVLGGRLVGVHLMESAPMGAEPSYRGPRNPAVERPEWHDGEVLLDPRGATPGGIRPAFVGVPEEVWRFRVGEHQVCEKWLKDRRGRALSSADVVHYQKIVSAIGDTIGIMREIESVIEGCGGFAVAFAAPNDSARIQAAPDSRAVTPFRPRSVRVEPESAFDGCLPLVPLRAAAGAFGAEQAVLDAGYEWVEVQARHRPRPGMFVAQVVGKSMEPMIPDGAYCIFASPVEGSRNGRTVLVQLVDSLDPETGQRYTVKRYESSKTGQGEMWRHTEVRLKPVNPDFEPIVLTGAEAGQVKVIAEFVEVLGMDTPGGAAGDEPATSAAETTRRPKPERAQQKSLLDVVKDAPQEDRIDIQSLEKDELICRVRQLFLDGPRSREDAIRELAQGFGYERVGPRVREALDNALRTAVRRGVLLSEEGNLALDVRRIEDYPRAFLKEQFLASLEGRSWKDRDESIRDLARWLGFRRTGPVIDEACRSIINGLLREGRIESNGPEIRRI